MSNWKSLPTEILLNIFQLLPPKESYSSTLVCKAWTKSAQSVLYSNIYINSLPVFKKFYNTVLQCSHIGKQVKALRLDPFDHSLHHSNIIPTMEEMINYIPNLLTIYLPNLEEFQDHYLNTFIHIMNALLDSRLTHLKKIRDAFLIGGDEEDKYYMICAFLMANRLERVCIKDSDYDSTHDMIVYQLHNDRLYNNLHQFNKLVDIDICTRKKDVIEVFEYVTDTCKSLKNIKFSIYRKKNIDGLPTISTVAQPIPSYKCRPNIKLLDMDIGMQHDYKILGYIIHKFPRLQELILNMNRNNTVNVDQNMLTLLLLKLPELRSYHIFNLKVDYEVAVDTFKSCWSQISKPGYETVEFRYTDGQPTGTEFLRLEKQNILKKNTTNISYSAMDGHWDHYGFLEANGMFIGQLQLKFSSMIRHGRSYLVPHENFIINALHHCPNLQHLHIEGLGLKRIDYLNVHLGKISVINELHLNKCIVYLGMFEQLSLFLTTIETLRLSEIIYRSVEVRPPPENLNLPSNSPPEITMPYTTIHTLIFERSRSQEVIYLKVFPMTLRKYHFYRVGVENLLEISNQREYNAVNGDKHISICCLKEPKFQFKYND